MQGRDRGRGEARGCFRGKGRGRSSEPRNKNIQNRQNKTNVQCFNCKKFGHYKSQYWYNEKVVNVAENTKVEVTDLFMASSGSGVEHKDIWLLDNGCSNHMTGSKNIFKCLNESINQMVLLGDNNMMKVAGVVIVIFRSKTGTLRELKHVQYVP